MLEQSVIARIGDWMQTFLRERFYPLDPRVEDIYIEDIAHSLSNICRFGGHTREFLSVAQHCVMVSEVVRDLGGSTEAQLWGLLHDASEAYLGDMVRPLKRGMPEYKAAEMRLQEIIQKAFDIDVTEETANLVHIADEVMLVTEARDQMGSPAWMKDYKFRPLHMYLIPWDHKPSKQKFLQHFLDLQNKRAVAGFFSPADARSLKNAA